MEKLIIHTGPLGSIEKLVELVDQLGYKTDEQVLRRNLDLYADSIFIAEIDKQIIGFLAYHILTPFHTDKKHMRIVSLVVDLKHRGRGVGKRLIQEAEKIAQKEGCDAIELTSAAHRMKSGAHAFYREQGYLDGETIYFRKKMI